MVLLFTLEINIDFYQCWKWVRKRFGDVKGCCQGKCLRITVVEEVRTIKTFMTIGVYVKCSPTKELFTFS